MCTIQYLPFVVVCFLNIEGIERKGFPVFESWWGRTTYLVLFLLVVSSQVQVVGTNADHIHVRFG